MRPIIVASLLAVPCLAGFAGSSQACWFRIPIIRVDLHPPVIQAPTPSTPGVVVSQPVPAVPADDLLPPPTPLPSPVKPLSVEQFAAAFKPAPGKYEVVLVHPKSGQPITVRFDLPSGSPRQVRWTKHVLEFDYGRSSVRIRFLPRGEVKVIS